MVAWADPLILQNPRGVSVMAPYTKAECYLEIVVIVGNEYSFRNDHDKGHRFFPLRWSRLCGRMLRLRQEQLESLETDHLLVFLPLLEDTPLPPASQTADFLALFPLGHGCSDIPLRHLHLGLEEGHEVEGVRTYAMSKASLARAGHMIIPPCWSGLEQFEIEIDLESALDIRVHAHW
jgi:hypothetical protein